MNITTAQKASTEVVNSTNCIPAEAKLSSLILLRNGYEKHPQSISGDL